MALVAGQMITVALSAPGGSLASILPLGPGDVDGVRPADRWSCLVGADEGLGGGHCFDFTDGDHRHLLR
ncbi:MAG: hypothetical protein R2939_09235 [Kofleriaceae bacterium]